MYVIKSGTCYWSVRDKCWERSKRNASKFAHKSIAYQEHLNNGWTDNVSIVKLTKSLQTDEEARVWLRENAYDWNITEYADGGWTVETAMSDEDDYHEEYGQSVAECVRKIKKEMGK